MHDRNVSRNAFLMGIVAGGVLAIALISLIFIGRQTFGQRCFDAGFRDEEVQACAERLSRGEDIWG